MQHSKPAIDNILSVDVEEWFHPEAVQHRYPLNTWQNQPARVEHNVDLLLELFGQEGLTATFFILGWIARQHPKMVRKIADGGHEVASHGDMHRMLTRMTPQEFEIDLRESMKVLEDSSGQKIIGFRAPTFSLVASTQWAWDIMLAEGIQYDSSVYPIFHDRYGMPDSPRFSYVACENHYGTLIEFPMPTLRLLGRNIPFGGGGYLRLLPLWYTRFAIKRFNNDGKPAIMYMHPWEFDTEQPRLNLGKIQSWRHYHNIDKNLGRLEQLLSAFRWTSFRHYLENRDAPNDKENY